MLHPTHVYLNYFHVMIYFIFQIIKNTVFLAKLLIRMPSTTESDDITGSGGDACTPSDDVTESGKKASLKWLMKRLCREAQQEAALNPKADIKVCASGGVTLIFFQSL